MRYLKLSGLAVIAALAVIGLLRITDLIQPDDASWLAIRAIAAIALLTLAGFGLGLLSRSTKTTGDSTDRPIP